MKIKLSELRKKMEQIISSKYYSKEEAAKIVEVLLYADMIGKNTQGILKLFGAEPAQAIKPQYSPKIERKPLSARVDGGGANGPLIGQIATDTLIEIAKKTGFAIVATNNTFSSVGAIGFYAERIARNNLIGFVTAGSPKATIHFGGIDPLYGTNPFAYGFPTLTNPVVFDMATSAITWYGLVKAKMLGEQLPENVAIDKDGNPTTDPQEAMDGALLPFDKSYKGSGLAMMMEFLTGPLTGAHYCFSEGDWGTLFIAFSPDLLVGTDEFKKNASDLVQIVKTSRAKPGKTLHIPGFDSIERVKKIIENDEIEIEEEINSKLDQLLSDLPQ